MSEYLKKNWPGIYSDSLEPKAPTDQKYKYMEDAEYLPRWGMGIGLAVSGSIAFLVHPAFAAQIASPLCLLAAAVGWLIEERRNTARLISMLDIRHRATPPVPAIRDDEDLRSLVEIEFSKFLPTKNRV